MAIGGHPTFSATYVYDFLKLHILYSFYIYHFIVGVFHFLPHSFNDLILFHCIDMPLIKQPIPNPVF